MAPKINTITAISVKIVSGIYTPPKRLERCSKSFVIPESSGVNAVTIGGIDAVGDSYSVDFSLREDLTLFITDASIQNSLSEILEQKLRKREYFEPGNEKFLFMHKVTYDSDIIRAAIGEGKEALISELRSDDFFPIRSCVEIIVEKVIELFEDKSDSPAK